MPIFFHYAHRIYWRFWSIFTKQQQHMFVKTNYFFFFFMKNMFWMLIIFSHNFVVLNSISLGKIKYFSVMNFLIPHKLNLGHSCYAYHILIKLIYFVLKRQHTLLYRTCKFIFVTRMHLNDTNVNFNVLLIFYYEFIFILIKNEYKWWLHDIYPCLWVILDDVSLSMDESFNLWFDFNEVSYVLFL